MDAFKENLKHALKNMDSNTMTYEAFKDIFMNIINKYAPQKENIIRGNNAPFMSKDLSKAFMKQSKLENKYNKSKFWPL